MELDFDAALAEFARVEVGFERPKSHDPDSRRGFCSHGENFVPQSVSLPLERSEIKPWRNPTNYLFFNKLQFEEDLRSRLLRYEQGSSILPALGALKAENGRR
jgi:hypothetical protein